MGTIIASAIVAHTAWQWMIDRADRLSQFRFEWPVLTAALLVSVIHWLMIITILAALAWLVFGVLGQRLTWKTENPAEPIDKNAVASAPAERHV
jgi:hypothetical protein